MLEDENGTHIHFDTLKRVFNLLWIVSVLEHLW